MNSKPQILSMLAPTDFHEKLSRRALFKAGSAAAGLAIVATACGGESSTDSTEGGDTSGQATGEWSRVINKSSGELSMYTWGDYNDPEIVGALAESELGVVMKVDYYGSNEDLIQKLSAGGTGFDIVVPTGPYIPQMIEKGLLQKFDKSLLPNMVNVDPLYLAQAWDTTNDYSVCKNWGSTGWIYDTTQITTPITTWQEFIDACMGEGSGNCSILDTAVNLCGMWFWANGKNWNTVEAADLDACEAFLVGEFAQHIKVFDSYPSTALAEGAYGLAMAWNGDARQAYSRIEEAGGDPSVWAWGLGSPATELWMDNYCITADAPNAEAAHSWINWLLIPEISIRDLAYHGYHSGMKNIADLITELEPDLKRADMIFFNDEQVATMQTQEITGAQDRLVDIYNKVKAGA